MLTWLFINSSVETVIIRLLAVVAVVTVVALVIPLNACFNPNDVNAVEVVFNKNGIEYNLSVLVEKIRPIVVGEGRVYVFKYVYRAFMGRDLELVATVYLEKLCGNAPCLAGFDNNESVRDVIAIRLEPLEPLWYCLPKSTDNNAVENTTTTSTLLTPYLSGDNNSIVDMGECIVKPIVSLAFLELLNELVDEGILMGLGIKDVYDIMSSIVNNSFTAGWNNRLLYNEDLDKWAPYAELISRGLIKGELLRVPSCSYELPREIINEVKDSEPSLIIERSDSTTLLPTATPTLTPMPSVSLSPILITMTIRETVTVSTTVTLPHTPVSLSTYLINRTEAKVQQLDGVATGIAISIGVMIAIAIYISWRYLSKA